MMTARDIQLELEKVHKARRCGNVDPDAARVEVLILVAILQAVEARRAVGDCDNSGPVPSRPAK